MEPCHQPISLGIAILSILGLFRCNVESPNTFAFALDLASGSSGNASTCGLQFSEFSFSGERNFLTRSFSAENIALDTDTLRFRIPYGAVSRLVANFRLLGDRGEVFLAGVRQESGSTQNDFTEAQTFEIREGDNCRKTVRVEVEPTLPVMDTGVTQCWQENTGTSIPCSVTNAFNQDGVSQVTPNPRSFSSPVQISSTERIVRDRLTGVVWMGCVRGQDASNNCSGSHDRYSFNNANNFCENTMNEANGGDGYANLKNWRLPTPQELISIMDYSRNNDDGYTNPSIFTNFPNPTILNYGFFSKYRNQNNTGEIWRIRFKIEPSNVLIGSRSSTTEDRMVICVSSPEPPVPGLERLDSSTIRDRNTGLDWRVLTGTNDWSNFIRLCTEEGSGFRLANANELLSLANFNKTGSVFNTDFFSGGGSDRIWTSTTPDEEEDRAMDLEWDGSLRNDAKTENTNYRAFCVKESN